MSSSFAQYGHPSWLPRDPKERGACLRLLRTLENRQRLWIRKMAKLAFTELPKGTDAGSAADSPR